MSYVIFRQNPYIFQLQNHIKKHPNTPHNVPKNPKSPSLPNAYDNLPRFLTLFLFVSIIPQPLCFIY